MSDLPPESSYQTQTFGTVHWMAPEFLRDKRFEAPADVYSYAVTLWEIIIEK
jgi:serine/threonine protein kinase